MNAENDLNTLLTVINFANKCIDFSRGCGFYIACYNDWLLVYGNESKALY